MACGGRVMPNTIPPPPPGFVLQGDGQAQVAPTAPSVTPDIPPPPPGFQMVEPSADPVASQVEDMLQSPAEETAVPTPTRAKPTVEEHAQYIASRRQAEAEESGPKLSYED